MRCLHDLILSFSIYQMLGFVAYGCFSFFCKHCIFKWELSTALQWQLPFCIHVQRVRQQRSSEEELMLLLFFSLFCCCI